MLRTTWATALIATALFSSQAAKAQETIYQGKATPLTTTGDEKRFVHAMSEIMEDAQVNVDLVTRSFRMVSAAPVATAELAQKLARYSISLNDLKDQQAGTAPAPRDLPGNEQLTNADPGVRK